MLPRGIAWHSPGAGSAGWFLLVCLVFLVGFLFCFVLFFQFMSFSHIWQDSAVGPFPRSWRALLTTPLLVTKPFGFFSLPRRRHPRLLRSLWSLALSRAASPEAPLAPGPSPSPTSSRPRRWAGSRLSVRIVPRPVPAAL